MTEHPPVALSVATGRRARQLEGRPAATSRGGSHEVGLASAARGDQVLAGDRLLPLPDELVTLFPDGGLRRGTMVSVSAPRPLGATALAVRVLSLACQTGSWVAAVGLADLGLVAARELGVCLDRFLVVPRPQARWLEVVAALIEGVDIVLVRPTGLVPAGQVRRLGARARERGTVLVVVGSSWPEADIRLDVLSARWQGIEDGHGYLQARLVDVTATGRRAASRRRSLQLWLPDFDGQVRVASSDPDLSLMMVPSSEELAASSRAG